MMLVVYGVLSGYKKLKRRSHEKKTEAGAGMRLEVEDAGWRVVEVAFAWFLAVWRFLKDDVIVSLWQLALSCARCTLIYA
jgi:hypothetical protein